MDFLIEFDYVAVESDELSVQKGDIVNNTKFHEDGWMIGTLKGKKGVFPSNFGKQVQTNNNDIEVINGGVNVVKVTEEESPKEIVIEDAKPLAKKVMGVGFGNIFSGKPILLKHTSVGETKIQMSVDDSKTESQNDKRSNGGSNGKAELVKVIYPYEAENPDELKIEEGDIITIVDKHGTDEGWWKGKINGKTGVFPDNFVVPYNPDEIAKPTKSTGANKTPPPPVTSKKPTAYKPKPAPPRPLQLDLASKIALKSSDNELEEINFESSATHKPLVGPTVERVRRQNIRPPKKVGPSNNDDAEKQPEPSPSVLSRDKSFDSAISDNNSTKLTISLQKNSSLPREKSGENIYPDIKSSNVNVKSTLSRGRAAESLYIDSSKKNLESTPLDVKITVSTKEMKLPQEGTVDSVPIDNKTAASTSKTSALKEKLRESSMLDTTPKFISARDKSKDVSDADNTVKSNIGLIRARDGSDVAGSNLSARPKSQLYGSAYLRDNDHVPAAKGDDQVFIKKKINELESKVAMVEDDNIFLKKEMADMLKVNAEFIARLEDDIKKLRSDLEYEKVKRETVENELMQLKVTVGELAPLLN